MHTGILIPQTILQASGKTTIAELFEDLEAVDRELILDIPAKRLFSQDGATVVYTGVLVNIPVSGYQTTLVAVPYMKQNGVYAFGTQMANSYYDVALSARNTTYSDEAIAAVEDAAKQEQMQAIAARLDAILGK